MAVLVVDEIGVAFQFVHFVGHDVGAATLAVNTAVDGGEVADDAVFGG